MRDPKAQFVVRARRKRRALEGLVEQFSENEVQKFVVFSRFTAVALRDIVEVCRSAGYTRSISCMGRRLVNKREQRLPSSTRLHDKAVFVSPNLYRRLGIDLSAAAISVFYSLPESLVTTTSASTESASGKTKNSHVLLPRQEKARLRKFRSLL
jgi:hypothetical protein